MRRKAKLAVAALLAIAIAGPIMATAEPGADVLLAVERIRAAKDEAIRTVAIRELEQLAARQAPGGALSMGVLIVEGLIERDQFEALAWLEEAARAGESVADWYRAKILMEQGATEEAVKLARKSAQKGVNEASVWVYDLLLEKGREREAVAHLEIAAERGNAWAQQVVALHYAAGRGVQKNIKRAYFWALLAEAYGAPDAGRHRKKIGKQIEPEARRELKAAALEWQPENPA